METPKRLISKTTELSMSSRWIWTIVIVLFISACSSGDDDKPQNVPAPPATITVSGSVQKGEFNNLQVDVYLIDANGEFDAPFQAQTNGSEYSFNTPAGQAVNLRAYGTFIDELSGRERTIEPEQALQSVFTAASDTQNVNILTTLSTQLWLADTQAGTKTVNNYNAKQSELALALGFESQQNFAALDITDFESLEDPSFRLLTLGAALLQQDPQGIGLPNGLSNAIDLIEAQVPVEAALDLFNGIDLGAVYTAIQQGGFIANLPELTIGEGTFFICEPLCSIIQELGPTVTVNNTFIYEGQGSAKVRLTRTGTDVSELTLSLSATSQSAQLNQDYAIANYTATFGVGQRTTNIFIDPIIDNITEGDEQVTLNLSLPEGSRYTLRRTSATVTIKDGAPASAVLPEQLNLNTSGCFVNIGLASELAQGASDLLCAEGVQNGIALDLANSDQNTLQFLSFVEADCSNGECTGSQYWPFSLVLETLNTQNNSIVSAEPIGTLLYNTSDVLAGLVNENDQARLVQVTAQTLSTTLAVAVANNYALRLRLMAPASAIANVVSENILLPQLVPAGTIEFGDRTFDLVAGAILLSGETCPDQGDFRVNGTFQQPAVVDGIEVFVDYAGEVCASFQANENGGTWRVSESDIDITNKEVILPDNTFYFLEVSVNGSQTQRTSTALPFALLGSAALSQELSLDSYITSDQLPFAFRITGASLTENGIVVSYDGTVLLDQPMFDATDPRAQASISNTNLYGSVAAGEFLLSVNGILASIEINAGNAQTAWPKGTLTWQAFSAELLDGQLQDHSTTVSFNMTQSLDCSSVACSQGNQQRHSVSGVLNIDAQGSGIGTTQYTSNSRLSWGALSAGNAWELLGALQQSAQATLVLPGFMQPYLQGNSENAADGLLAHRRLGAFIHSTYGPNSDEYTLGNFFAAGINIGPEVYVNGSGQPDILQGSSLADLSFELNDGVSPAQSVSVHEATKFVIQNAGVSGVVNADPASMPSNFNVSGFDIDLERFALRTQNNTNDTFNWIDGSLALDGDAKIEMAFNNLALGCDGSLSDAQMLSQACGEQCRLDSWRADIDIFSFGFSSSNGSALACSNEPASLNLEHDIAFKAIDKNLAMRTRWSAQGELQDSATNGQSQYRFDSRDDKQGFPIIVDSFALAAPFDLTTPENTRYGTLEVAATIGVPFWLPLSADLRLANTTSFGQTIAEPSVVLPSSSFSSPAFQAIEASLNLALQGQIRENEQFDFEARYEWGNTGFGFQLPVYYDIASATDEVGFLGRKKEIDMFVLDAGAGIDFIQPDRTKLSFGASADFAALKQVRFQVDLTDTQGLAKIDELLVQANIIQEPIIVPTFENISNAVNFVNSIAGRGLDPLMERLLLEAVTGVGQAAIPAMPNQKDPFDTLADSMAEIKNFPNHLIVQSDQVVFEPINMLLDEQEDFLRAELLSMVQALEALAPGEALQAPLKAQIDQVRGFVFDAENRIDAVFNPVNAVLNGITAQIKQIEDAVSQAQAARVEIEAVLNEVTSVVASQCAIDGSVIGSESAGYLQGAFQQLNDIKGLVQILSNADALGALAGLVVDDPQVKESISETQDTLREGATALLAKITETEVAVRERLCQSDISTLLTQVNNLLLQIDNNIAQMQQVITNIDTEVLLLTTTVQSVKLLISTPLGNIKALIGDIERLANDRLDTVDGEAFVTFINANLEASTGGEITTLVATDASDTDIFEIAFAQVRTRLDGFRSTLIAQLKQQTKGLFPYGDMSADQLRRQLVTLVMASDPVSGLRQELNTNVVEIIRQANSQVLVITDQANAIVQEALAKVENEANKVLEQATAPVRDIPLDSGKLDGFAVIAGNELERAHIGAQWTMNSSDESEPGNTFGAALDAVSWSANGKAEGCAGPGAESNLDITISAMGIPAKIGESEITIKKVYLGFTLGGSTEGFAFKPIGVNGGISTTGEIGFTEFIIYDPAFAAGIGLQEVYLGASAGAIFSDIQAEVAFLVGKTCNQDILMELDPKVAQYIELPATGFTGAYVRGAASVPVYSNGCPLTIGVAADMGAWILKGPPLTLGGLVGGGAYGKVGCVGALRGQIRALGQVNTDGDITFIGEGFGVAGLGLCEPAGWTSVERSRQDGLCGTADAVFTAGYQNGWSVFNLSVSAIH